MSNLHQVVRDRDFSAFSAMALRGAITANHSDSLADIIVQRGCDLGGLQPSVNTMNLLA